MRLENAENGLEGRATCTLVNWLHEQVIVLAIRLGATLQP